MYLACITSPEADNKAPQPIPPVVYLYPQSQWHGDTLCWDVLLTILTASLQQQQTSGSSSGWIPTKGPWRRTWKTLYLLQIDVDITARPVNNTHGMTMTSSVALVPWTSLPRDGCLPSKPHLYEEKLQPVWLMCDTDNSRVYRRPRRRFCPISSVDGVCSRCLLEENSSSPCQLKRMSLYSVAMPYLFYIL